MGDPAGIGPEVVAMAAATARVRRACRLTLFGDQAVFARAQQVCRVDAENCVAEIKSIGRLRYRGKFPRPGRTAGDAGFRYLDAAARAVASGDFDGLATAPINKLWLNRAGHAFDGHTGYLSQLSGATATMMLAGKRLRVVLVTTHIAHAEVASALTTARIRNAAITAADHLARFHDLPRPRLAVAALNPHGGESGLFGDEERRVIAPAVASLRRTGLRVEGPFPADTLFAAAAAGDYDAVVCMYHDQALIPLKLLDFGRAVNVTMGLPFIRTSPDHGTAYSMAGTGRAQAGSMVDAIVLASTMARYRSGGGKP